MSWKLNAQHWVIFGVFAVSILLTFGAYAGDWIADTKTGCKVWNPRPAPGETVTWAGACKDGLAEGKGALEWRQGGNSHERDEGEWRAGRQMGEGAQTWPQGQYKGQFADGLPHGRGVLTFRGHSLRWRFFEWQAQRQGRIDKWVRHVRWRLAGWLLQ